MTALLEAALEACGKKSDLQIDRWLARQSGRQRTALQRELAEALRDHAQKQAIVWYRPANPEAEPVLLSTARQIGIVGGNRSSKTDTALVEFVIRATGVVPLMLRGRYPESKLRQRPLRARLVVTSLTVAWDNNLKQKLQWWVWNGKPNEDGLMGDPTRGHWGWIPPRWLINGDWEQSWSDKHQVLTLNRWGDFGKEPGSTLQVMSHKQDLEDFAQGAFHLIIEDELPPEAVHRENKMRTLDYRGQIIVTAAPPDEQERALDAAWFHDEIYQPGLEGSAPDDVLAVTLWTEQNRTLEADDIEQIVKGLSPDEREARLHGRFLHLSGVILRDFTDKPRVWCFTCHTAIVPQEARCPTCRGTDLAEFCHVWDDRDLDWPGPPEWPLIFYMDPHQAKPTACGWFKIDPNDGLWMIKEAEIAGDAECVKTECERIEQEELNQRVVWRKADPKITAQTNQFVTTYQGEKFSIRRAFEEAGFWFEDANTNFPVSIDRIKQALKPTPILRAPRLRIHAGCTRTRFHVTHFAMEGSRPSKANSDFVAVLRYCLMDDPTWLGVHAVSTQTPIRPTGVGRNPRTGW